ncbi:serine protease espP domain protein [Escherichia coli DEC6D]|nr:serine protease espP domain protein [Escherichia coli DEC6D]
MLFSTNVMASHLWIDNFYVRDYLDFAQNKGKFTAGNENISFIKKMVLFINFLKYHFLIFLLLLIKEQRHQLAVLIV